MNEPELDLPTWVNMYKSQKHHVDWEKQVTEVFVEYFVMYIKFEIFKTLCDVWEFVHI